MDLFGSEVGGGAGAGEIGIRGVSIGDLPGADLLKRCRNVFLLHEISEALIGGQNVALDGLPTSGGQALLVRFRERRRHFQKRLVEAVPGWVLPVHTVELGEDFFANHFGQQDVFLDSLAHQSNVLVHVGGKVVHAAEPVVVVLDRLKAQRIDHIFDRLDSIERIGAHQIPLVLFTLEIVVGVVLEDVVADLVLRGELGAVDGVQAGEHLAGVLELLVQRVEAEVFPLVVPAAVAQFRGSHRIVRHLVLPVLIEQLMQGLGGGIVGRVGGGGDYQEQKKKLSVAERHSFSGSGAKENLAQTT